MQPGGPTSTIESVIVLMKAKSSHQHWLVRKKSLLPMICVKAKTSTSYEQHRKQQKLKASHRSLINILESYPVITKRNEMLKVKSTHDSCLEELEGSIVNVHCPSRRCITQVKWQAGRHSFKSNAELQSFKRRYEERSSWVDGDMSNKSLGRNMEQSNPRSIP